MVPPAAALAGPPESAFGRTAALWGCAALCVAATAAVLCVRDVCVRDVRNLTRHSTPGAPAKPDTKPHPDPDGKSGAAPGAEPGSADTEGPVGRFG